MRSMTERPSPSPELVRALEAQYGRAARPLASSGLVELVDGRPSIRACDATVGRFGERKVPTLVSKEALAILPLIKELVARGVITGVQIHDDESDAHPNLQEIEK